MSIAFIYKFIPIFIIHTDRFMSDWMGGRSYGAFVLIKPEYKDNIALLQHELTHCKQFYRTFGIHSILYNISTKYRLKAEIEAYKQTIEFKGYTSPLEYGWIVNTLYNNYNLDVDRTTIHKLLAE